MKTVKIIKKGYNEYNSNTVFEGIGDI